MNMGPPTPPPFVRIVGRGVDVMIRINDDDDRNIVNLALNMAERHRYEKMCLSATLIAKEEPK